MSPRRHAALNNIHTYIVFTQGCITLKRTFKPMKNALDASLTMFLSNFSHFKAIYLSFIFFSIFFKTQSLFSQGRTVLFTVGTAHLAATKFSLWCVWYTIFFAFVLKALPFLHSRQSLCRIFKTPASRKGEFIYDFQTN